MSESVGWIGVVLALIALGERVYDKYNTRKSAKEKAEAERLAALDKLTYDSKFVAIEGDLRAAKVELMTAKAAHAECHDTQEELKGELAECREQHKATDVRLREQDSRILLLEAKLKG